MDEMISGRKLFKCWICMTTALALLAAVILSPLWVFNANSPLSQPHPSRLRRNFAIPPARAATSFLKSFTQRTAPVKSVCMEDEEEKLIRTECLDWCSFGPSLTQLHKALTRPTALICLARASQPLRC